MALSITVSLDYSSAGTNAGRINVGSVSKSITPAAVPAETGLISVGTSDETLSKGDVSTIGYVYLRNLDATNYIEFGTDGSAWPLKLKAGEFALVRWNSTNVHAKANTGACNLQYAMISD